MLYIVAALLLLSAAAKGNVWRTLWALTNLVDTLRSLKEVRANGRRVGVTTRRKLIKQCLVCWIVFVAAQPVGLAADMLLFWFPFYKSIKSVVILVLIVWRLQTSAMIFDNFIVPTLRRHEKHIDLTILLIHSVFALFSFFLFYLPARLVRAVLVAIGVMADSTEPVQDSGDTPPESPTDTDVTHTPSSRPSALMVNSPHSSSRKNRRQPSPSLEQPTAPVEPARKPKTRVSKTISERTKVFESSAADAAPSRRTVGRAAVEEEERVPHKRTTASSSRHKPLPKPPVVPQREPGASTSASAAPVRPSAPKQTTRSRPTASKISKTEELLNSLPAPPATIPSDLPAAAPAAPPAPPPRARRVNAPGPAATQPPASRPGPALDSGAESRPASKQQLYPTLPRLSPPKKRPRAKGTAEDDSSEPPVKRVASGGSKPPIPKPVTATATKSAARTSRVTSDSRKDTANVPTTKRTRPTTRTTSSSAPAATTTASKKARTTRTTH